MSEQIEQDTDIERATDNDGVSKRLLAIHAAVAELISSPSVHDALELALATVVSLLWMGDKDTLPVWLIIIGNPSSGKTDTVLACKNLREQVLYVDTLTDNAFGSGFVDDKQHPKYRQKNRDLLGELEEKNKTLIIKDLTTLFSLRDDKLRKILGELTSIYDGSYSKWTGTIGQIKYEVKFPILACITPAVLRKHHNHMSQIGGRFLMFHLMPLSEKEQEDGFDMTWNEPQRRTHRAKVEREIMAHIEQLFTEPAELQRESILVKDTINRLAQLLARGRGTPITERAETGTYEIVGTQVEEPWRVLNQLRSLSRALALVHGRLSVSDHELELLRRVVFSSIPPDRAQVLMLFSEYPGGMSVEQCAERMQFGERQTGNILNTLVKLNVLEKETVNRNGKLVYKPVPRFADLIYKPTTPINHIFDLSTGSIMTGDLERNSPLTNSSNTPSQVGSFFPASVEWEVA